MIGSRKVAQHEAPQCEEAQRNEEREKRYKKEGMTVHSALTSPALASFPDRAGDQATARGPDRLLLGTTMC